MATTTVYHGGYCPVPAPEIRIGRFTKDFGPGFYCTTIKEQAERWANRYETPAVSIYDLRINTNLNIIDFQEMNDAWLDLSCPVEPVSPIPMTLSSVPWQMTRFTTMWRILWTVL